MAVPKAAQRIDREVTSWAGVTHAPHPFGGRQYRAGRGEIGHLHGDDRVDVPFPMHVHDEIVAAGLAEPHRALPNSGWVSKPLLEEPDVELALALLRRAYDIAVDDARKAAGGELDKVDQAGRESFPASDPPSWNP